MHPTSVHIEEWHSGYPRWTEVSTLIEQLGQTHWVDFNAVWHVSTHLLVAATPSHVVGFLRYVIQNIGVEEDRAPVTRKDITLLEAKVIAVGVTPNRQRQGIGRALQEHLIQACRTQHCFQIRSYSYTANIANWQLKLSLGFTIHPLIPAP
ncbi:MAG: GNAT family N-acetyltransferase [Chloroflexota bacterium]